MDSPRPQRCHSGKALPPPETVPCGLLDPQFCEVGHYIPQDSVECAECPVGHYSVGSSQIFNTWEHLPSPFQTSCDLNTDASCSGSLSL